MQVRVKTYNIQQSRKQREEPWETMKPKQTDKGEDKDLNTQRGGLIRHK